MWTDVVVIRLHSRSEGFSTDSTVKAPDYLGAFPECPVQAFKDVIVRLRLKVFKSDMGVLDSAEPVELILNSLLVCRESVGHNCIGVNRSNFLGFC